MLSSCLRKFLKRKQTDTPIGKEVIQLILAELNIFIQFAFMFCVLISLQLRSMEKVKAFGISMIAIIIAFVVSFFAVLFAFPSDPMFTTHAATTLSSTTLTAVFGTHLFLAIFSLVAATWTVALWFKKNNFIAKSKIPALITQFSWLLTFALGLWMFINLNI
jgi:hypothetical protein